MKSAILVNGVPASGKSSVARAIAGRLGAPLMTLDGIKQPLFEHFGVGDREHNRKLGRASYAIIFSAIGNWPDPITVVIDAWFGFQPREVLQNHLASAGVGQTAELWCHAPASVIADRYAARVGTRSEGHPGLEYVPELVALTDRATPMLLGPCRSVDTTATLDLDAVISWLDDTLADAAATRSG